MNQLLIKNYYMKIPTSFLAIVAVVVLTSWSNISEKKEVLTNDKEQAVSPYQEINLNDLSDFKPVSKNWKIVGNVNTHPSKKGAFDAEKGTGILLNIQSKKARGHIFTNFEHGDIEVELDVMMPSGSNSGLYFQGRYEVQLLDSWGVEEPQHSDIGGIYQRWDNSREKKGYEGIAPKVNAAKAPGLWQHFKIIFQAPKFDASGNKTENAMFREVWLNGALLHKDQEVSGPTRSGAFNDEKELGSLMIQGDHGGVAFRNIKYKHGIPTSTPDEDEDEKKKKTTPIEINVSDETVMQRGFLMHKDVKRTHCISVGTTNKVNYSYDLANGSLLQVWGGKFLDVTKMWHRRGAEQLAAPIGIPIVLHGEPDFTLLKSENVQWPASISKSTTLKQLGYELDQHGNLKFQMQLNTALISNLFIPSNKTRSLDRIISTNSDVAIYHKIGEGSTIEKLPNNTFAIDDKNYFVEFSGKGGLKPFVRNIAGKDELLVKIPSGSQNFSYTIIW